MNQLGDREEEDQFIICIECGEEFVFSVGEQHFYLERDLQTPKRCQRCRDRRKAQAQREGIEQR